MPDALVPSPLLAVVSSPAPADQDARERLETVNGRLMRTQHALPDEFQGLMVTRWSKPVG